MPIEMIATQPQLLSSAVPTNSTDAAVAAGADVNAMAALAKDLETRYERLKLVHNDLLNNQTYAPLLVATPTISDAELQRMIQEAGWTVFFDERFGTPRELAMWLDRFRRFRSAVIKSKA